jgi:nucleotide-binding universal stress UspA family protein
MKESGMQELIVALDESQRSINCMAAAQALAAQMGLPVRLLSVVSEEKDAPERRQLLERKLQEWGGSGGAPVIEIKQASSPVEGLAEAADASGSLLCIGTHGRRGVAELALGSVASGLLQRVSRPLVLTGPNLAPNWGGPVQTVMACLEGSPLSEAVLPVAVELSQRLGAGLMLLHVVSATALQSSWSSPQVDEGFELRKLEQQDRAYGRAGDVHEASYLRRMAAHVKDTYGVQASWEVLHGDDIGEAIAGYARGAGHLIAMTTHGRSGLARLALGSVAVQIVRTAECPVVVLRPEPK